MAKPHAIIRFEWDKLRIGQEGFTQGHLDALVAWQERQGISYFDIGHRHLHFRQWVGVIQVDGLNIEILPKIKRQENDRESLAYSIEYWRKLLIEMLHRVHGLPLRIAENSSLALKQTPLLQLYLEAFLREAELLVHQGLVKKYRQQQGNRTSLKGRLMVPQNISKNLVHRERFVTISQEYDRENQWNQILLDGLRATARLGIPSLLLARAKNLALSFPDWPQKLYKETDFANLVYDRKSESYRRAMGLAKFILLQNAPHQMTGTTQVFAILFDMNQLWEAWLEYHVKRCCKHHPNTHVYAQKSKRFWEYKTIRPDLVIEIRTGQKTETVILDAKWKQPTQNMPSDNDLKQMFVYNLYWRSTQSFLVYPTLEKNLQTPSPVKNDGRYAPLPDVAGIQPGSCNLAFCNVKNPAEELSRILDQYLDVEINT